MDFSTLVQILRRSWWIFILVLLAVIGFTAYFTYTRPPLYRATASFVVWPEKSSLDSEVFFRSLNTLERRSFIATYAKILSSGTIQEKALSKAGIPAIESSSYEIISSVIPDTNIIRVSVTGPNPDLAKDLANSLYEEGEKYIKDILGGFGLRILDRATIPSSSGTSIKRNISMAIVLGILLGIGAMIIIDYFLHTWSHSAKEKADSDADLHKIQS